jgi:hypothetical protein
MANLSLEDGLDIDINTRIVVLHSKNPVTGEIAPEKFELPFSYLLGKFFKATEFSTEGDGKMHIAIPIHPDYLSLVYEYMMYCKGVDFRLPLSGTEYEWENGFGSKVRHGSLVYYSQKRTFKAYGDILRQHEIEEYDAKARNLWITAFFDRLMPRTPTPEGKLGHARCHTLMVLCDHYLQLRSLMRLAMRYIQWFELQYLPSRKVSSNGEYVDFALCDAELKRSMYGIFERMYNEGGLYK